MRPGKGSSMKPSRREFLGTIVAAAAMKAAAASGGDLRNIGLQLYTVRDLLSGDFEGTLEKIAQLGYQEVEFVGNPGPDVRSTRNLLTRLGISAPSLHIDYNSLRNNAEVSFDTAMALGASYVVCPWLDKSE